MCRPAGAWGVRIKKTGIQEYTNTSWATTWRLPLQTEGGHTGPPLRRRSEHIQPLWGWGFLFGGFLRVSLRLPGAIRV